MPSPSQEPNEFLEFIYGEAVGYIYAPTKNPTTEEWDVNWFRWPEDRVDVIKHFRSQTAEKEVYYGPALYTEKNPTKQYVMGSNVVWTEFDGNIPSDWKEIPAPSMRVQSSENGYEHVYWRLNKFEYDRAVIERINRSITFALGADGSSWDCTQILRPVGTLNHKHDKRPVTFLAKNPGEYSVDMFGRVPEPPSIAVDLDMLAVPEVLDVVAKYKWRESDFKFFKGKIEPPIRSDSLMRLAYIGAELKMTNEEIYSILINADDRWKKYYKRRDRKERLLDLINRGRIKYPLKAETSEELPLFYYGDFMASEIKIEWIIPGILQRKGYFLLSGPQGIGKTQISLMFAQHMAIGKDFIGWQFGDPVKIIFFSMEMGDADLKYFLEQQRPNFNDEELDLLQENFIVMPIGFGVDLTTDDRQKYVEALIRKHKPAGIVFDSLGLVTEDELSGEKTAKSIAQFNARIREEYDLFVWFIHHNRKAQATNKKPNKLEDIFGSIYVTTTATTIVSVWQAGEDIEVKSLKVRLSKPFDSFIIKRNDHLGFARAQTRFEGMHPQELQETPEEDIAVVTNTDSGGDDEGSSPFTMQ